jgi:hypothetical protein
MEYYSTCNNSTIYLWLGNQSKPLKTRKKMCTPSKIKKFSGFKMDDKDLKQR